MAVFRVEKTKDFTVMCNHHLRNTALTLKAKGLLSLMLSLPEDWDYTTRGLAHICKDGVDSITTALKELERYGYLTRQRLRCKNGQLGDIEYIIHEKPVTVERQGFSPKRENPEQEEPIQENPAQLNTELLRTKKLKTNQLKTYSSIYPAEPESASQSDGIDRIDMAEVYHEIIKENIEYGFLVPRYGQERIPGTVIPAAFPGGGKSRGPQEKQPGAAEGEPKRPSKLEFTADELPPKAADKKLTQARRRAERVEKKLENAEARLPSQKKLRMETASDPETGKVKKRLKFEQEVKSQRAHVKGSLPMRPVKAAANTAAGYAHKKIYQAEEENVCMKAAHRTELVGEAGARTLYHRHKTAPYRRVTKLQQKSARANAQLAYRQTLSDHPELKKNFLARMWQKQKLKRQYAKAAREAQKTGKRAKDAAVTTEKIAASVVNTVKRHPVMAKLVEVNN